MTGHLSAELLLEGYRKGIFPMSENKYDAELFWVNPKVMIVSVRSGNFTEISPSIGRFPLLVSVDSAPEDFYSSRPLRHGKPLSQAHFSMETALVAAVGHRAGGRIAGR